MQANVKTKTKTETKQTSRCPFIPLSITNSDLILYFDPELKLNNTKIWTWHPNKQNHRKRSYKDWKRTLHARRHGENFCNKKICCNFVFQWILLIWTSSFAWQIHLKFLKPWPKLRFSSLIIPQGEDFHATCMQMLPRNKHTSFYNKAFGRLKLFFFCKF